MHIWLGGLFAPEAYITASRQCVAQANLWPLEELYLQVFCNMLAVYLISVTDDSGCAVPRCSNIWLNRYTYVFVKHKYSSCVYLFMLFDGFMVAH